MDARDLLRRYGAALAALLAVAAYAFPWWTVYFQSPIFGTAVYKVSVTFLGRVEADPQAIQNINIGHHYVGLPELDPDAMVEVKLTPAVPAVAVALAALTLTKRVSGRVAALAVVAVLVGLLAYVQYWLYALGHSIKPGAPVKIEPITPLVVGVNRAANFTFTAVLDVGFWLLVASAILLYLTYRHT